MRTSVGFILENTWCSQDVLAHEVLVKLGVLLYHDILVEILYRVVHRLCQVFLSAGFFCIRHSDAGSVMEDHHVRVDGLVLDAMNDLSLISWKVNAQVHIHLVLNIIT